MRSSVGRSGELLAITALVANNPWFAISNWLLAHSSAVVAKGRSILGRYSRAVPDWQRDARQLIARGPLGTATRLPGQMYRMAFSSKVGRLLFVRTNLSILLILPRFALCLDAHGTS